MTTDRHDEQSSRCHPSQFNDHRHRSTIPSRRVWTLALVSIHWQLCDAAPLWRWQHGLAQVAAGKRVFWRKVRKHEKLQKVQKCRKLQKVGKLQKMQKNGWSALRRPVFYWQENTVFWKVPKNGGGYPILDQTCQNIYCLVVRHRFLWVSIGVFSGSFWHLPEPQNWPPTTPNQDPPTPYRVWHRKRTFGTFRSFLKKWPLSWLRRLWTANHVCHAVCKCDGSWGVDDEKLALATCHRLNEQRRHAHTQVWSLMSKIFFRKVFTMMSSSSTSCCNFFFLVTNFFL